MAPLRHRASAAWQLSTDPARFAAALRSLRDGVTDGQVTTEKRGDLEPGHAACKSLLLDPSRIVTCSRNVPAPVHIPSIVRAHHGKFHTAESFTLVELHIAEDMMRSRMKGARAAERCRGLAAGYAS